VRTTTALSLGVAVLATAAACGGSSSGGQPSAGGAGPVQHPSALDGTVGKNDAFTISLTDDAGDDISNLAAGRYKLTVHDDSGIHNFHLSGSGVNVKTDIQKTGTETFTVNVKPGIYTFVCDIHPQMKGSFTVS